MLLGLASFDRIEAQPARPFSPPDVPPATEPQVRGTVGRAALRLSVRPEASPVSRARSSAEAPNSTSGRMSS